MSPSPARKWRHQGRLLLGLQSLIVWGLLLPPRLREQWHRSRPFELAPAGEPATDPTPTAARSLARLLRLPQPDNVDGSQVGALLEDFAPHWRSLLGNCRATSIVEDGVGIAFQQRPQLTHQCISFRTRNSRQDLQQAVDALLMKGAIERVTNVTSIGYYSRLFLVPKKTGVLRPVIDLSTQLPHGSFTLQDGDARARPFSHQKSGVDGIDRHTWCLPSCSDAPGRPQVSTFCGQQESVPVHLSSIWAGDFSTRVHQAAAARRRAVKAARCEATRLLGRLADQSRYSGTGQTARPDNHQGAPVSRLDHQLREVRPHSKSRLPVHRDAVQHSTIHSGALPKMRLKVQSVHQHGMTDPNITARDLHRLLGMLVFMASLVRWGRLRLRPVQWWATTAWCQRTGSWSDRITVPQWVLQGLPQQSCKVYPSPPRRRKWLSSRMRPVRAGEPS